MFQEKRPTCVTVIGWAWIVIGGLASFSAIPAFVAWSMGALDDPKHPWITKIYPLLVGVQFSVALLGLVAGINFLKLKAWPRAVLEGLTWFLLICLVGFLVFWMYSWISITSNHPEPRGFAILGGVMAVFISGLYGVPLCIMLKYLRGSKIKNAIEISNLNSMSDTQS
ncbi:MAG TPA: hypothetical protein VMM56_04820 [Planctomycetaceae bacterium]|nr:hypothetical protein [Planctomycetaceae bacterium]